MGPQVIVDTAGRQVIDDKLMGELKSIKNVVKPTEVLLVVDAMTGQEAATVTARFNDDIGITGACIMVHVLIYRIEYRIHGGTEKLCDKPAATSSVMLRLILAL